MRARSDTLLSAIALTVAVLGLGHAIQLANGAYTPDALFWVSIALVLSLVAVACVPTPKGLARAEYGVLLVIAAAGIAQQISVHLTTMPGIYMRVGPDGFAEHHRWVAGASVAAGLLLALEKGWARCVAIAVFCGAFCALGFWMLRVSPAPIIDVFTWHKVSYAAFANGTNPWSIFMPNIYGQTLWYAPGLADAAQVKVGYPYPPLTFMLGGLANVFTGDYRYADVVACTAAGVLLAFCRPGRLGPIAAALFFLTPRSLFVLEQGWTEPLSVFMFALVVFCACRFPRALPYALGLLFAVKQYFVIVAPLALLLLPAPVTLRSVVQVLWRALAVAVVLTLPFFLWDPGAFWRSVVEFQGKQPFRIEALSYVAATAQGGQPVMPLWLSFPAALVGLGISGARSPRTPAGFAAGSSLVFLLFFAFAKQAFCNYYFLIIAMMCAALAATVVPGAAEAARPDGVA